MQIFKLKIRYYDFLTIFSIVAIIIHLLIKILSNNPVLSGFSLANIPLLTTIIVGGLPLLFNIIKRAFKGDLGADLLAAIALVTATYLQQFVAADLIVLMLASGQSLENYAGKKASFALEALSKRVPAIAHKKNGDQIQDIKIDEIAINDLIVIYPFETSPVDGVVFEGYGSMDESYLTGEPYQMSKAPGSSVISGAINSENLLVIKAEKLAQDSRYAKIIQVMQDAETKKPKLRRLGDKFGAIFAPIALIFAALTWAITGEITRFLAILVVATPCPLLIAIPIAIISAISVAAKNSIIIKDPTVLEQLPICTTAIFDKTGTLTSGEPEITKIIALDNFSSNDILQISASLEQYSRHPLALAINKEAKKNNIELLQVKDISEKAGEGLKGHISQQEVLITSRHKIENSDNINLKENLKVLPQSDSGLECIVIVDNKIAGLLIFHDQPRSNGKQFINHLSPNHQFKKIILLSGDRESEVKYLANLFEIENTFSSQSPEQKFNIVREETKKAPTLFIGDGINDAPSLAVATVGVAFGKNNIITSEAAKAVIMENSLAKVDELIHISEYMRKIIFQSAVGGMVLSFLGMILASLGFINPVEGAILQEIIDVVAILNALRLIWKKDFNSEVKD